MTSSSLRNQPELGTDAQGHLVRALQSSIFTWLIRHCRCKPIGDYLILPLRNDASCSDHLKTGFPTIPTSHPETALSVQVCLNADGGASVLPKLASLPLRPILEHENYGSNVYCCPTFHKGRYLGPSLSDSCTKLSLTAAIKTQWDYEVQQKNFSIVQIEDDVLIWPTELIVCLLESQHDAHVEEDMHIDMLDSCLDDFKSFKQAKDGAMPEGTSGFRDISTQPEVYPMPSDLMTLQPDQTLASVQPSSSEKDGQTRTSSRGEALFENDASDYDPLWGVADLSPQPASSDPQPWTRQNVGDMEITDADFSYFDDGQGEEKTFAENGRPYSPLEPTRDVESFETEVPIRPTLQLQSPPASPNWIISASPRNSRAYQSNFPDTFTALDFTYSNQEKLDIDSRYSYGGLFWCPPGPSDSGTDIVDTGSSEEHSPVLTSSVIIGKRKRCENSPESPTANNSFMLLENNKTFSVQDTIRQHSVDSTWPSVEIDEREIDQLLDVLRKQVLPCQVNGLSFAHHEISELDCEKAKRLLKNCLRALFGCKQAESAAQVDDTMAIDGATGQSISRVAGNVLNFRPKVPLTQNKLHNTNYQHLPQTSFVVSRTETSQQNNLLEVAPAAFRFWDKYSFVPASGPRHITTFGITIGGADVKSRLSEFLNELRQSYEMNEFGLSTVGQATGVHLKLPTESIKDGKLNSSFREAFSRFFQSLTVLSHSEPQSIVTYVIDPVSTPASVVWLVQLFVHFNQAFVNASVVGTNVARHRIFLQILPLSFLLASISPADYQCLAMRAYNACEPVEYHANLPSFTKLPAIYLVPSPPEPPKFSIRKECGFHDNPELLQSDISLHLTYALAQPASKRAMNILIAAWTESTGQFSSTKSIVFPHKGKPLISTWTSAVVELCQESLKIMRVLSVKPRLLVSKHGRFSSDEVNGSPSAA